MYSYSILLAFRAGFFRPAALGASSGRPASSSDRTATSGTSQGGWKCRELLRDSFFRKPRKHFVAVVHVLGEFRFGNMVGILTVVLVNCAKFWMDNKLKIHIQDQACCSRRPRCLTTLTTSEWGPKSSRRGRPSICWVWGGRLKRRWRCRARSET